MSGRWWRVGRAGWVGVSLALLALFVLSAAATEAEGQVAPERNSAAPPPLTPVGIERAFPALTFPNAVHLTHAADGSDRIFVVQQEGIVRVFPNSEEVEAATTFLDIQARVLFGGEQGLLSLAFDPDFPRNGYFYVYYIAAGPRRSVVSRFQVRADDPNQVDPASELVLLEVLQPFSNHNGGLLAFGPDGHLYVGLGDGGSGGDPFGHGQNTATLLGSLLRIDVRGASPETPYRIPIDNPFVAGGGRAEIYAYGLRNPWRYSFDRVSGTLWLADVGQSAWEEVDIIVRGGNYGWNRMEGAHCYPPGSEPCDREGLLLPIVEYDHSQGCSITGGHVYWGSRLQRLRNAYIYGDYCSGKVWGLRVADGQVTENVLLAETALNISSFGEDEHGEVYILDHLGGGIHRFAVTSPTFSVQLQGRPAPPNPSWVMGFRVDLYAPGADPAVSLPIESHDATSSEDGTLTVDVTPGVYDIRAKGAHTLRVLVAHVDLATPPAEPVDLGVQVEGDHDGDNVVDVRDYSALLFAFGTLTADLPLELRTLDFNQDGVVDVGDYAIVLFNFGLSGVPPFG